jgi:mRNA (guanine-N7-)-methyltransferase
MLIKFSFDRSKAKASGKNGFGNSVFNIKFDDLDDLPLFGAKYNFSLEGVVNCPEFLVYFPALVK